MQKYEWKRQLTVCVTLSNHVEYFALRRCHANAFQGYAKVGNGNKAVRVIVEHGENLLII